jgi:hypothetical protein
MKDSMMTTHSWRGFARRSGAGLRAAGQGLLALALIALAAFAFVPAAHAAHAASHAPTLAPQGAAA